MQPLRIFGAYLGTRKPSSFRERRMLRRMRTRLRPGKVLDRDHGFLADCAILDRTSRGVRIRCFGPLAETEEHLAVFDEKDATISSGRLVWHRKGEAGIRLDEVPPAPIDPKTLRSLSAPYYAVTD